MKYQVMLYRVLVMFLATAALVGCGGSSSTHDASGQISYSQTVLSLLGGSSTVGLTLTATVASPTSGTLTLQATDMVWLGTYLYVSYNNQGSTIAGAVEVIDMTNPARPSLVQTVVYSDSKVNSLAVDATHIYLVGNTSDGTYGPAYVRILNLSSGLIGTEITHVTVASFAANSILLTGGRIYVSSGDQGGLSILDGTSYALLQTSNVYDSRWVSTPLTSGQIFTLGAQTGRVITYNQSAGHTTVSSATIAPSASLALSGATVAEAKSTLVSGYNYSIAALGAQGFNLFCNLDGKSLSVQTPPAVSGVSAATNVTNQAVVSNGLIYASNGEGGVQVYSAVNGLITLSACANVTVTALGQIGFGTGASSNAVYTANNYLFVATGLTGLKVVQVTPPTLIGALTDFNLTLATLGALLNLNLTLSSGNYNTSPTTTNVSGTMFY